MNRIKLLFFATFCSASAFAQLKGDGYYRVQSTDQQRYVSIVDNRGSVNVQTTTADMKALRTVLGFERVVSDPGSIIYIKKMSTGYDLQSQGTGSYSIISYEVLVKSTGDGTYWAYASNSGLTKYLADETISWMWSANDARRINGSMVGLDGAPIGTEADWNILPVTASGSNYFGISPSVTAGGNYYQSFYASFPFTLSSSGMNSYYVTKVDEKKSAVVISELTAGVPSKTPVIVKCSSNSPSENRLNIGANVSGSVSGNKLKGVFFCNDVEQTATYNHRNVTAYNPSTMRVLGNASDGSLAFVKSSTLQYIPANTAYITVSTSAPDELKVYTQAEYDALPTAKRGDLNEDGSVDGQDLVIMVNMILEKRPKTAAADLSGDNDVDGLDYVKLVNLILGKNQ